MSKDPIPLRSAPSLPAGAADNLRTEAGNPELPADKATPRAPLRIELSVKSTLTVVAVGIGLWLVVQGAAALLVLITALMLVGALHPVVLWLEKRKIRRFLAICLVFAVSGLLTTTLLMLTGPPLMAQVRTLADNEPKIRQTVASYLDQSHFTSTLANDVRNTRTTEFLKSVSGNLLAMGTRVLEIVAYLAAAVFLAFYMMLDRDRLRGALFAVVPRTHHIRLSRILMNLGTIVGGYIRGQFLTCVLMGLYIFVVLTVAGIPNALAFAALGGIMDLLPYIGIFLTVGPVVLMAATQSSTTAMVVFLLMLAYEEFESRVLVPLVYGRTLRLPSSVVFFALILGTTLAGIVGALLALPLAAAALMVVEELRIELPGETVLPEDTQQRRQDNRTEAEYERRTEGLPVQEAAAVAVGITADQQAATESAEEADRALHKKS